MSLFGAVFKIVNELNAFSLRDTREKALGGDVREQFLLGTAYLDGQGVDKNDWEAAYWFQRAADQGHAKAMTSLGLMYCLGRGVPRDAVEGVKWLTVATRRGHAPAKKSLDTAKLKLTPEELATAEQYADDFIRQWDDDVAAQEAEAKGLPAPTRASDTGGHADAAHDSGHDPAHDTYAHEGSHDYMQDPGTSEMHPGEGDATDHPSDHHDGSQHQPKD